MYVVYFSDTNGAEGAIMEKMEEYSSIEGDYLQKSHRYQVRKSSRCSGSAQSIAGKPGEGW